eukprot:2068628-Pyramimonas_sp.AAC.1
MSIPTSVRPASSELGSITSCIACPTRTSVISSPPCASDMWGDGYLLRGNGCRNRIGALTCFACWTKCGARISDTDDLEPKVVYEDIGLDDMARLDYVRDPGAKRWAEADADRVQARTHKTWKKAGAPGTALRRVNAQQDWFPEQHYNGLCLVAYVPRRRITCAAEPLQA